MDVNGKEMHDLFKFMKRHTPFFVPRYAMATRIYDYNTKFLCNRYGEVQHYYTGSTELAVIESDIAKLIKEDYVLEKYRSLIEPPDMFL